jgi:hypothetical protein
LLELCDLVLNQRSAIGSLAKEIPQLASKTEIEERFRQQAAELAEMKDLVGMLRTGIDSRLSGVNSETAGLRDWVTSSIETTKTEIEGKYDAQLQQFQGDYFIIAQQVKELQKVNMGNKKLFSTIREDLNRHNSLFNTLKEQNIEVVLKRVDKLEGDLHRLSENQTRFRDELDQQASLISGRSVEFEADIRNELQCLTVQVAEARRLVIDTPTFEVEGAISTEALIRAIQRDSRRIDNFNETVLAVKHENDSLRILFSECTRCLDQFQTSMAHFVEEHNAVKRSLVHQIDQSYVHGEDVRRQVRECEHNLADLVEVSAKSANTISSAFLQVYSFLTRLTSRGIPGVISFDEELLEFQRLCDLMLCGGEEKMARDVLSHALIDLQNRDRLIGDEVTEELRALLLGEFKMLKVSIPNHDIADLHGSLFVHNFRPKSRGAAGGGDGEMSPLELKRLFGETNRSIEAITGRIDDLERSVQDKLDTKAEYSQIERLVERTRAMRLIANDDLSGVQRRFGSFIRRDEVEGIIRQTVARSPGKSHPRLVGVAGVGVKPTLPDLPAQPPHEQLYGPSA